VTSGVSQYALVSSAYSLWREELGRHLCESAQQRRRDKDPFGNGGAEGLDSGTTLWQTRRLPQCYFPWKLIYQLSCCIRARLSSTTPTAV